MVSEYILTQIEERAAKASAGPWSMASSIPPGEKKEQDAKPVYSVTANDHTIGKMSSFIERVCEFEQNANNAEFIARARSDIPLLIHEVRRLNTLVAKLKTRIKNGERHD